MPATRSPDLRWSKSVASLAVCVLAACLGPAARGDRPAGDELSRTFAETIQPILESYCLGCHGKQRQEAQLDLSVYSSLQDVSNAHPTWELVLERFVAEEMPPEEAKRQPQPAERAAVVNWIRAIREYDAHRNAGDPGPVLARRLSNAEYNYTIRDLTFVDIQPTSSFPVDPANKAGFDNSGESLTMSPALLNKYLAAARDVADHLVLTPTDFSFAPHPVVTDTDRDKYCVKRIVRFYQDQATDLAQYFFSCWQYRQRQQLHVEAHPLQELASRAGISGKYAARVWNLLNVPDAAGPVAELQQAFRALPSSAGRSGVLRGCQKMRDYVLQLRPQLSPRFDNLVLEGSHKGSQPFVLWKNRQYANHRREFNRAALYVEGEEMPDATRPELVLPRDEAERARHLESIKLFCSTFPDAFYVSERGRDYLDVPREQQEKGRLLSAGFHSMMGYFRDDGPLCELILDEQQQQTLDRLWQELDYVASAPTRQYLSFLWFERTDSRYMRDPVFDFARAEDKNSASQVMIKRLAAVYLEKARRLGASDLAITAIQNFFDNINAQIRWGEARQSQAEQVHLRLLLRLAARGWRRKLLPGEADEIQAFYGLLRNEDRLNHKQAIRDSVVSILMSPHFLYRMDLASAGQGIRQLSGFEMASRLSYFLWSTLPDDELIRWGGSAGSPLHAAKGQGIVQQARRMLDDERIRGLATEFAANWLDFRRFEQHNSVDRNRFPEFTDELRRAMFEEPIRFFVDLVRNDRSVLELLDGDHTFVNLVLAKHYGMQEVDFSAGEWARVDTASRYQRGGLLPMSVFLTNNSPGLRTSPVKRGYWVVRRLLGERIPPPPPNVPELPADESQLGELSLRELLARHRDHKSCAGCHDRIDSIGLAFEGYGPVGRRRDNDLGGRPVQVTATFPGGGQGSGLDGLRRYLQEQRQQEFLDNLCRKLLSYALGRTLLLSDEPLIEKMRTKLLADDYRFRSLIEAIVSSRQFLNKRGSEQLVEEN